MPKTAFLVLKSPQELDATHVIGRFADRDESVAILAEDGVYHALLDKSAENLGKVAHEILAARDDIEARGFTASDLKAGKAVEYSDIIDCIMERTERTVTM